MATNTIEAFYLGTFTDIDPDEGNWETENSGAGVGATFGGALDPLHDSIDTLTLNDTNNDGTVSENDNGQTAEPLTYGGASSNLDSVTEYNVTITYSDGTTAATQMVLLQDESGRTFLVPFLSGSSNNAVLNDKPIESITLDSVSADSFGGVNFDLEDDAFIDGTVDGTSGDDTISTTYTDAEGTQMNAYGGDDTVDAGAGNDTVEAGLGNDEVDGGTGNDSISGGDGDDSIQGGDGNDTIDGGSLPSVAPTSESLNWSAEGADEADISGGFTQDTGVMDVSVSYTDHGAGDEFTVETTAKQYVGGGEPFSEYSAAVIGGDGNGLYSTTTINFASNTAGYASEVENVQFRLNDIDSESWTDRVTINAYDADGNVVPVIISQTGSGDDSISGNQITGAGGTDNPDNESGSATVDIVGPVQRIEVVYENTGTNGALIHVTDVHFETLLSTDDDTLSGGAGDDVFIVGTGHDTITDFNTGNSGTLSDGDATNNDFIDLSGHYDHISELHEDQADDGILNQSNSTSNGGSVDYSDNTRFSDDESLTFQGASADGSSFSNENTGVVCFTSGTAIRTPRGDVLIDDLRAGDYVCTLDNGVKPIRWIGRRCLDRHELAGNPQLRPVLIRRGALGAERDLVVSPQHGILMPDQTLVRAKFLAEAKGNPIRVAHGRRSVTYIHLLFDAHQIIFAENICSESLFPGKMAFAAMGARAQAELKKLFPDLNHGQLKSPEEWYGDSARSYIRRRIALRKWNISYDWFQRVA